MTQSDSPHHHGSSHVVGVDRTQMRDEQGSSKPSQRRSLILRRRRSENFRDERRQDQPLEYLVLHLLHT